MKESIFAFVNQYAVWGILLVTLAAALLLWRMHRQMKRLNKNLGTITAGISQYLNVIMEEDDEEELLSSRAREYRRDERFYGENAREARPVRRREQDSEDEAVFNEVIQEYFS